MVRKLMLGLCLAAATFAFPSTAVAKGNRPQTAPAQATGSVDATEQGSNFVFTPDTITVSQGGTVTFKNTGQAPHTATANDGSWDSSNLNPGDSFTTPPLTTVGTVQYKCTYHANLGMVGTINVVAASGKGGPPAVTATVSPTPSPSPSFYGSGLPSPQAAPTPPPSQKYFPKIGGALLVLLVLGLGLGYVKLKGKLNDKG